MFKLLNKYFNISKLERINLNRIFFWLIYSLILVRLIPLKWFSRILGEFKKELNPELDENKLAIILMTKRNIRRCKRIIPWKVKCFEEAIAAKKVLEKQNIKSTLYLGVNKDKDKNLVAHAWLKTGENFITGRQGHEKYVVVGFYC